MQARDISTKNVVTVKENTPIEQIAALIIEYQISGLPVVDDHNLLVGMVTEHDLLYKRKLPLSISWVYNYGAYTSTEVEQERRKGHARIASEIMTDKVVCIEESTPLVEIVGLMISKGLKRLPVTKGRELLGIVSKADVLKAILSMIKSEETIHVSQGDHDQKRDSRKETYLN